MLLNPGNTLFVRNTSPVLLLADASIHDALPVLNASDGVAPGCEGWSVVPRLTLCAVDGPGAHGLVVPTLSAPVVNTSTGEAVPATMTDWCADAERTGGALVLSLLHLPATLDWHHLLTSGTANGGFMPAVF